MKRIIAFLLCLSMLFSTVPVSTFAAEADETAPVTEVVAEPVETVPAETQSTETAEEEPSAETEAPQESSEVTEPVSEAPAEDLAADLSGAEETEPEETVTEFTWIPQGDLPSAEDLFAGYVEKTFYGESSAYGTAAGNRLTGITKDVYDLLRPQIEEIAAGERSSSEITARDLDNIDLPETFITDLFNALLADLPYDLYWFDKTSGVGGSYGYDRDGFFITLYFCVSPHYSATGAAETFDLDTAKTSAASAAAANALSIVDKYEDASDYDKLVGYKKEICNITSYNDYAASQNYDDGYGDPWQLIWVFDGLASTKVVCEGYSKAFQYLCDLSDFDADIVCYNVQGYMGSGGHMWNIVSINGKSYLADITNSDGGSIGSSGGLFLVGKAPNSDGSYTFLNQKFTYGNSTIYQWGLDADSILILDTKNFDPDDLAVPPAEEPTEPEAPSGMTGEELQEILNAASGQYMLTNAVEVTSALVIPEGVSLLVCGDAAITVKNGGSITIPYRASLGVANGGSLTVEAGGTMTVDAGGSIAVGGGTTVTVSGGLVNNGSMDINYGTLNVTGTYSGDGSIKQDLYATVTGIDTKLIQLYSYAYTEDMLIEQLVPHTEYASTTVYLMCVDSNYDGIVDGPLTITQNVVVPENVQLNLGYFVQNDQFILADGASLTVNGEMNIMSTTALTINAGARLINNGYIANFGTIVNNGILKGNGAMQQSGTFTGNAPLTAEESAMDDFLQDLEDGNGAALSTDLTLAEDLTVDLGEDTLLIQPGKTLYVPDGVTLTLNSPVLVDEAVLWVEAGGELIINTDVNIVSEGGMGFLINRGHVTVTDSGALWIDDGATLEIARTGVLDVVDDPATPAPASVHISHNAPGGALRNSGTMNIGGYLSVMPGGWFTLYEDATLNVLNNETGYGQVDVGGMAQLYGRVSLEGQLSVSNKNNNCSYVENTARVEVAGLLNCFDGSRITVGPASELVLDGTLNASSGSRMTVFGNVSGFGFWDNAGTVHFGVAYVEAFGLAIAGNADNFSGTYIHNNGSLEVELFQGQPISVDLMPASFQTLVYDGNNMDAIRTALANAQYQTRVTVIGDVTVSENLTVGYNAVLDIQGNMTIAEDTVICAYGPVIVSDGGVLNVDGTLKLYHPRGTLTVEAGSTVNVAGTVFNGTSVTVHGLLDISGTWEGYFPNAADGGIITGEGAPTPYDAFLRLIQEAYSIGYTAVVTSDLVIPEYTDVYCDLAVAPGVTLTLDGNLAIWGSLTVEEGATVINNAGLSREHTGHITVAEGSVIGDGTVYNACMSAEDYEIIQGIPMDQQSLLVMMCTSDEIIRNAMPLAEGYKDATLLVRHEVILSSDLTIPANTTLRLYREIDGDGNVIPAIFTVPEDVTLINNGTFVVDNHSTLILDGEFTGNRPQVNEGGSIDGNYNGLSIGVETKVQPSFLENSAEFGLWAGAKMSFSPVLFQTLGGDRLDSGAVQVSVSEGAENYAKIARSGSLITVTANSNLSAHQVISFTFTAENAEPTIVNLHLRPKATGADILLDGQSVTGQTVLADLNRGDSGFQLSASATPADAVPANGTAANGGSLVTWKSSAPAIATVDDNGYVTFTGEKTGKVKITATANYGAAKAAVVTINVTALPQELFSSESNPTVMSGSGSATFTATDANGTVLKSTAVKWFLCDEDGSPLTAHPYASITAAGKLTTKAVADETLVYLMAQVIGDERSALLPEPVCVKVFPALEYAQILLEGINANNATLLYDVNQNGMTCQLDWAAGPYEESVQSVSWKSSKPAVANIDQNGLITLAGSNVSGSVKFTLTVVGMNAKKHTASFTVKFGTFTQELDLSVILPDGTVTDDVSDLVITGGETLTFSGSCLPGNVTTNGITWSLDSKTYGTISSKGVLKTKAVTNPTTVTVTAASKDGYTAYAIDVTLMPKQDALIILNEYNQALTQTTYTMSDDDHPFIENTVALEAISSPSGEIQNVTWTSSNPAVADVSADGILTALSKGTSTITATAADGRTAAFTLKVGKLSVNVEITPKTGNSYTVISGKTLDLVGTVSFSDGSTGKAVTWSMTYPDGTAVPKTVATISSSGKVAAAKGLTSATTVCVYADAKDGNWYGWADIEIVPVSTAIEIFGPFGIYGWDVDVSNMSQTWNMSQGTEFSLFTKVFPLNCTQDVTWKSSAPKVVEIDDQGNVRCLKSGTATITATAKDGSGKKTTLKLTVVKTMDRLELPETAVVGGGKSLTFTKMDGYAIDTLATNQTLTWSLTYSDGSSVPTSVATLSKGVLKTKAVSRPVDLIVRAEATDGSGLVAECFVTVCPLTTSVSIVNAPAELYISSSVDLDAVCSPSGAAQDVTWKTSGASVATVDADGVVTALKAGSVTITATAADGSGKKATVKIKVCEAPAAPPASENVQISMIAAQYGPDSARWWAQFVRDYEAANPNVDLMVDVVSWNDIYTVINHRIANNQTPDILNIDIFADFQADGLLLPVKDYMSDATYSKFFPEFLNESKINGTVWAVPDLASARALYYNADLLAELGIKVPETWDELLDAAQDIKATYGDSIIPLGIDMTTDEGQATFAMYAWNNGGGFLDSNGNWKLNSAQNVETVEFLRDLVFDGLANPDPTVTTRYDLQDMLGAGQVAMTIAPYGIENYGYSANLAAAPIPSNTGDSVSLAAMDRMMCFDNNYTDAELAAITAFFDLFYEDERYAGWTELEGFLPVTSTGCDVLAARDSSKAVWGEILSNVKFYPFDKAEWYDVRMGVIDVMQRAMLGGNVSSLLNTLQQEISGESAPTATELSMYVYPIGNWGNSAFVGNMVSSFEEETGIRVKVTYVNYADGDAMIDMALASGTAPDLVLEGPERLTANWGARGVMADLSDMFDTTDKAEILPAALNAFTSNSGAVYGYPLTMMAHSMAINKTVFEAAGAMQYIDEETHTWTTENFFQAVDAVYDYTGHTVGAVYCGGQGGDQGTRALVTNLYGGSFTNPEHTAYTWDSYENVAALKALYDCAAIEYDPGIVGGDEIALFRNGVLNMAFCWNSVQQMTNTTNNGDEIMFMSFPSPNGTDAKLQSGVWGFGIFDNGNDARVQAAKQFIKYCCDSKATADAVRTSTYLPVRSSAEGTDLTGIWSDDPIMQEYSILMPLMGDYCQVTPNWAEARTNWWNMLQLVSEYGYSEELITSIAREYTFFSNNP